MPDDFAAAVQRLGVPLDNKAAQRFRRYRDLMATSAREFNLTAVRDPDLIETRHLLEGVAFGTLLEEHGLLDGSPRVLDIGSGAGLPGLPLKLIWPEIRLTLLDSHGKRCRFLEEVISALGLQDADVVEARAEEGGRDPALREAYDLVVARAVAPLPVLLEYALPFLKVGGRLAATKGSAAERELEESTYALRELSGEVQEVLPFYPPEVAGQTVIIVRKTAATPERYPRRTGIPSKRPL